MKTMKLFLAALFFVLFAACNGIDTNFKFTHSPITLAADETTKLQAITFHSEGAWHSSIVETRTGTSDWIAISPDHGDQAGDYKIDLTLKPNDTETERSATITIVCPEKQIVVTVIQQAAETQEPAPNPGPTAGNRIVRIDWYNLDDPAKPELELVDLFTYDDEGRLTRCEERPTAEAAPDRYHTLAYGTDGTVEHGYFTNMNMSQGTFREEEHNAVTLDADRRWARWTSTDWQTTTWTATYADGRIVKRIGADSQEEAEGYNYLWDKGNLVRMEDYAGTAPDEGSNVHLFEYTETANPFETTVVDPVWLNTHVEYYDDLALGFYDRHSNKLLKSIKLYDDYACTDFLEQTTFEYTFDQAGRIVRVDIVNTNGESDLEIREYGLFTYAE